MTIIVVTVNYLTPGLKSLHNNVYNNSGMNHACELEDMLNLKCIRINYYHLLVPKILIFTLE